MKLLKFLSVSVLLLALLLTGCGAPEAPKAPGETTEATLEATDAPTEAETVTEEEESVPYVTVSHEDLQGVWIAAAEPVVAEDTTYNHTTNAGYYEFAGSNFIFTQVMLAERSIWEQLGESIIYKGTFELHGDMLILHYTEEAGQAVDYTEEVSMLIDRSCADMCVRTPDHPKLGPLKFFRKARSGDPVNSITILLNGSL